MPLLEIDKVSKIYSRPTSVTVKRLWKRRQPAVVKGLDNVSMSLQPGAIVGVIGESGAGKTTLAKLAAGMESPTSGVIRLKGLTNNQLRNRKLRARTVQLVWQNAPGSLDPRMNVNDIISEPVKIHSLDFETSSETLVRKLLAEVGLSEEIAGRYPHQLSGGEAQRVVIARALVLEPKLLICDEPASALDVRIKIRIADLLSRLRRERGLSLLIIAHDLMLVRRLADEIVVMRAGRVVESGPAERFLNDPSDPYSRQLIDSEPRLKKSHPSSQRLKKPQNEDLEANVAQNG